MKKIRFSLCLVLSVMMCSTSPMNSDSDADSRSSNEQDENATRAKVFFVTVGSSFNLGKLLDQLRSRQDSDVIRAAKAGDLEALRQHVTASNVNTCSESLSLLSHSLLHGLEKPQFDTAASAYLIEKGALIDHKASSQESNCPMASATQIALYSNKFAPLEFLLSKNGNPFLDNQAGVMSSAFYAVVAKKNNLTQEQNENRTRILALLTSRARNLHEALETFDIPTIQKFLNQDTANQPDATGTTPLVRVALVLQPFLRTEGHSILKLLFSNSANANQVGSFEGKKCIALEPITIYSIKYQDLSYIPLFLENQANPKLNPNLAEEDSESPYDIAQKCAQRRVCCEQESCPISQKITPIKKTAEQVLELFNAYQINRPN